MGNDRLGGQRDVKNCFILLVRASERSKRSERNDKDGLSGDVRIDVLTKDFLVQVWGDVLNKEFPC